MSTPSLQPGFVGVAETLERERLRMEWGSMGKIKADERSLFPGLAQLSTGGDYVNAALH